MVIASYNLAENNRVPYVTIDEVKFSATASGIDFTNLIENGSRAVQERALSELIVRASVKADNYVFGALGTLCATEITETGRYRANRSGQIIIQPYQWPIMEVRSFSIGYGPGDGLNSVPLTSSNCWIERFQFLVTPTYSTGIQIGSLSLAGGQWATGREQFVEYAYVAGFSNTFLAAPVTVGATSISVKSATGIYPGSIMTIWDGMNDETITVSLSYNGSSTTLPLSAPLVSNHAGNVNVSALPATVKQAVIHFVVAMIKQRGQGGLVLNEIGEPVAASGSTVTSMADEAQAYDLLDDFQQIWGRA
jgi:hypothetical protein